MRAVTQTIYSPEAIRALVTSAAHRQAEASAGASVALDKLQSSAFDAERAIKRLVGSLSDSADAGLLGARRAILADLDRKQQELEGIRIEIEAEERRVARGKASTPKTMMDAWHQLAREIAAGAGDLATRKAWASAHVKLVRWNGQAWAAEYWLPADSSTGVPQWHPERVSVELLLTLAVRRVA
jgi:hypothetical protein